MGRAQLLNNALDTHDLLRPFIRTSRGHTKDSNVEFDDVVGKVHCSLVCRWDMISTTSACAPEVASRRPSSGYLKSSRRAKSSSPSRRLPKKGEAVQNSVKICRFRGAAIDELRADVRLYSSLQEHALRVMQVVEKVVARLDNQESVNK